MQHPKAHLFLTGCLLLLLVATVLGAQELPGSQPGASGEPKPLLCESSAQNHAASGSETWDSLLELANTAARSGDVSTAEELFLEVASSDDPWYSWSATSGLVATYRMLGDYASAFAMTRKIRAERPQLAELMAVWDGDTAVLEGDLARARVEYQAVATEGKLIDGMPVGALALKQLSRLALLEEDAQSAAAMQRELLRRFPAHGNPEFTLAQAMVFDAMATGSLPLSSLDVLLQEEVCSEQVPCVIDSGIAYQGDGAGMRLAELSGLRFRPAPEDLQLLAAAREAKKNPAAGGTTKAIITACTVTAAYDGFQDPMTNDHSGYVFMQSISQGYHPGIDINGPGSCDDDCGLIFRSVARGCVRDSSPADWGSAVVEHYYLPDTWYSQYGHADDIYYSAGASISKGANLGTNGDVGTRCCHLHHELREPDHPDPTNANYYSSLTKWNVGDWYQNPLPFYDGHPSYSYVMWADEGAFSRWGTWTYVSGVGDRDDMRWAYTTNQLTNYARYSFSPGYSGTYELWVFVPYNHATSTRARYKVRNTTIGGDEFSGTVNQSIRYDEWVNVGSGYLFWFYSYYVEVATNTEESSKKVGLDDILLIRR